MSGSASRAPKAAVAGILLLLAVPAAADEGEVRRGKLLFAQPWRVPAGQDPVGPLFNASACADCHPGGGPGAPGGPALVLRTGGDALLGSQIQPLAVPGVSPELLPSPVVTTRMVAGTPLTAPGWRPLAARLAPGLRGLGLLAAIPAAEIERAADPDDRDGDGVSGRLGAGRFGAKAEDATLAARIEAALAMDMGLATDAHAAPAGDCTTAQADCLERAGHGAPVPASFIASLAAFVAALRPRPGAASAATAEGRRLFAAAGCGTCHAGPYAVASDPAVTGGTTETVAPFTDLLLHDLGPGLADPFPSPPADAGEWRTAPLWGLSLRPALLHDGRAADPRTAILWHDGEAAAARYRFTALDPAGQAALLAFLASL